MGGHDTSTVHSIGQRELVGPPLVADLGDEHNGHTFFSEGKPNTMETSLHIHEYATHESREA